MPYKVSVISEGYSKETKEKYMIANCTCTVVQGDVNMVVDTLSPSDASIILAGLDRLLLKPEDIQYCIGTHGHTDHIGNLNLFPHATHIVGHIISENNKYWTHPFDIGKDYVIDQDVTIIPTPGHTLSCITVAVNTPDLGMVAIAGDLFEREDDIGNPLLWQTAGSESLQKQLENRFKIINMADHIIPGHGPMFKVLPEYKESLKFQLEQGLFT